jgi:hypothetical protein
MLRLVRRLAILSAINLAFSGAPLPAQSSPGSPDQSTPAQSPATGQQPAQQPGTLPEQPAPSGSATPKDAKKDTGKPISQADIHNASLWRDPGNISAKDLFYGEGGKDAQPVAPFKFVSEDMNGTNPKFDVKDATGKKWRVKLAEEARPEVVASRLLWAVGYYVNDDYLLHVATIQGLDIKRGTNLVHNGQQVIDARFERKADNNTKIAIWEWKTNPFRDTREFNGLRVMMAVLNNWDLKEENNAIRDFKKGDENGDTREYEVSDLGASFGTTGRELSHTKSKGNLYSYARSTFIKKVGPTTVDFDVPSRPEMIVAFNPHEYFSRVGMKWIGDDIPRQTARWIGDLLGQLSQDQIRDAFRAAGYEGLDMDEFAVEFQKRVKELQGL